MNLCVAKGVMVISRYIDAEFLIDSVKSKCLTDQNWTLNNLEYYVNCIPTADVVEVIRCKECKWWRPSHHGNYGDCILLFDRYTEDCESCFDAETECDGFCEKGERKMDG